MKAIVYVTLKPSVLDPQGKAILHSIESLGFEGFNDVRQGKYFEMAIDESVTEEAIEESLRSIAKDILANPVIEDYRVEIIR